MRLLPLGSLRALLLLPLLPLPPPLLTFLLRMIALLHLMLAVFRNVDVTFQLPAYAAKSAVAAAVGWAVGGRSVPGLRPWTRLQMLPQPGICAYLATHRSRDMFPGCSTVSGTATSNALASLVLVAAAEALGGNFALINVWKRLRWAKGRRRSMPYSGGAASRAEGRAAGVATSLHASRGGPYPLGSLQGSSAEVFYV
jgi:hypothetical protein